MSIAEQSFQKTEQTARTYETKILEKLFRISKSLRGLTGIHLAEMGLHPGEDDMLLSIIPSKPLAVNAIADNLGVRPSTVLKMADRLAE